MELAAIGSGGDVAQSALAGLGLRDAMPGGAPPADLTDRLIAAIREREALLILDNPSSTTLSPNAFRSPEAAIAVLFMAQPSPARLSRP